MGFLSIWIILLVNWLGMCTSLDITPT